MKTKLFFVSLAIAIVLNSCIKDEDTSPNPDPNPEVFMLYSGQNISADFFVRVMDELGAPVAGAVVVVGNEQAISDDFGIAQLDNVTVDSDRAHVSVSQTGYFDGYRNLNPSSSGVNYVNIELSPRTLVGSFNTSSGDIISFGNGVEIDFTAGSLKNESGDSYDGNVNVYASYIDPSLNNFGLRVPGDLIGLDNSDVSVLESYGMIGVELESDGGEILNLGDGQEATLSFPVPSSLSSSAPATIPLWFYDTEDDVWEKEGEATLNGSVYEGNVSHFTWWNCDIPWDFVTIEFNIEHGEAALPLENANFAICVGGFTATGTTNSDGLFEGQVPINETLTLKVYDYCGNEIYSQEFGPFASDTDLGTITAPAVDIGYPIIGTAIDCDGNPVTAGYVVLNETGNTEGEITVVNPDGTFMFSLLCANAGTNYQLIVADTDNAFLSDLVTFSYDDTQVNDLGNIDVCDQVLAEYFTVDFDGATYSTFDEHDLFISPNCIHLYSNGTTPSGLGNMSVGISLENLGMIGIAGGCTLDSVGYFSIFEQGGITVGLGFTTVSADVTSFPSNFGDYIQGSFTADYEDFGTGGTGTLTGTFSILND